MNDGDGPLCCDICMTFIGISRLAKHHGERTPDVTLPNLSSLSHDGEVTSNLVSAVPLMVFYAGFIGSPAWPSKEGIFVS